MELFIHSIAEVERKQFFSKEVTCWTNSRASVLFSVVRICLHNSFFLLQLPCKFEYEIKNLYVKQSQSLSAVFFLMSNILKEFYHLYFSAKRWNILNAQICSKYYKYLNKF